MAIQDGGDANEIRVFLDYRQEELDRAYDQRAWARDADMLIARMATASARAGSQLGPRTGIAYGPTADETLDIFCAATPRAPILIFIHGGAWRAMGKEDSAFAAETFLAAGATFIVPNFSLIPTVRLPQMADQLRRMIGWVYRNAVEFGGDPERIHIVGHSSGGHLAAVMLTTRWSQLGLPDDVIKGGTCVGGMYDLHPVLLSARSSYLKLDDAEAFALSPIHHIADVGAPVLVAVGEFESPEFRRQAEAFAAAMASSGHPPRLLRLDGVNHFAAIELLADRESRLARAVLAQMRLPAA